MTTTGDQTIERVGLGWPTTTGDVSRETAVDVSRDTVPPAEGEGTFVGLGWPA